MKEPASPSPPEHCAVLGPLHTDDDAWLSLVHAAERPLLDRSLGDYTIHEEIRVGGQAIVFRAQHARTGREVALKRLAYGAFASPAERRRFERELEAMLALQHPGIVTMFGIEDVGGVDVLAMEWVDGKILDAWAREQPDDPAGRAKRLDMFLQICDAVQHAHQRGVIHRDLKPSNIMVDREGRCRVLDFGLAQRLADASDETSRTIGFVGTPAYAAPERFAAGTVPIDVRSDVYSLGVVLFELLTRQQPFQADSLGALIQRIERDDHPRPSSICRAVDRDLDAIVARAMDKRSERRYATVHALAEDVRRKQAGAPVHAVHQTFAYVIRKWAMRHRGVAALSLTLVVVVAAAIVFLLRQSTQIRDERDAARAQRDRADAASAAANLARDDAEAEARKARAVANFYLDLLEDAHPRADGLVDFVAVIRRSAERTRESFGDASAWAVEVEANLATILARRGLFAEACELAQRAYDLHATLPDGIPTAGASALRTLAESHSQRGEQALAVPLMEQSLAILRTSKVPVPKTMSASLHSLALMLFATGRATEAAEYLREAVELSATVGAIDTNLQCRARLAVHLSDVGDYATAERMLEEAMSQASESQVSDQVRWALSDATGHHWHSRGDREREAAAYKTALEFAERFLPREHPQLARSYSRLGLALYASSNPDAAFDPLERALELGIVGLDRPVILERFAVLLHQRGEIARSAEHYEQAWRDYVAELPAEAPDRVVSHANWLAALHNSGVKDAVRAQLPGLFASVGECVAAGGWPPPDYWPRIYEIGKRYDAADAASAALRDAFAVLQRGPHAERSELASIAAFLATLER